MRIAKHAFANILSGSDEQSSQHASQLLGCDRNESIALLLRQLFALLRKGQDRISGKNDVGKPRYDDMVEQRQSKSDISGSPW